MDHHDVTPGAEGTSPLPPPLPPEGASPPPVPPKAGSSPKAIGCIVLGAIGGIFTMFVVFGIVAAIMLPALARAREAARRESCQNNLKQIHLHLQMYAEKNDGMLPGLSPEPGNFVFDDTGFIEDPTIFLCPSDSEEVVFADDPATWDWNYIYLGFPAASMEEAEELFDAYMNAVNEEEPLTGPLTSDAGSLFERLRIDTPGAAKVPLLVERWENHIPAGANVLYLDGHVEYVRLNEGYPVTSDFYDWINYLMEGDPEEAEAMPEEETGEDTHDHSEPGHEH